MAERRGDYDVVLLGSGSAGYGDARNQGRDSYAWSINVDMRSGRAVPAAAYTRVLAQSTLSPIKAFFEWENSDGDPILIWTGGDTLGNATIFEWINATLTTEIQNIPAYTSGILDRFDQDATEDADEEMSFFCNGSAANNIVRRKKDGTTDTGATTAHTAKAGLLAVVGADVYRTVDGYKLGKLTARTDPGIDTNYPTFAASVPAGRPTYAINKVLSLGASPIVISGNGVYKFNPAPTAAVFDTWLEFRSPHPDNGKAAITDGRGRLYVDSAQGHLIVITFGFQQTHTPTKHTYFDRNTPQGKISAMAVDLDHPYVALEPGTTNLTQNGVGLFVQSENDGVFTDHTANVTSRKWNSEADLTLLGATNDFILFGTTDPSMGFRIEMADARGSETPASALTVEYSSGVSSWTSATIMDSTLTFAQDGLMSMHNSFQHPFEHATPWTSFASAADTNSVNRYWMRIKPGSTLTGVKIREVHALPYRPSIAPDRNSTTDATRMSGYKQAGALPTILVGTWRGERIIWQDVWTLWTSKIEAMVVGRVNDGVTDSESALYALSHDGLYAMPVGPDGDPARASWPNLGDPDTLAAGLNDHMIASTAHDFGLPAFVKTVDAAIARGHHLQSDDEFYLYSKMEHEAEWTPHGPFAKFPVAIKELGDGKTLQVIAAYKDGSLDAIAPQIESITVPAGHWTYDDDELIDALEEDTESPQAN